MSEQDVIADLKTVCGWCKSLIQDGPEPTSHGICPECASILVGDTWHLPSGDGVDERWLNAYIATQLQDVLARRFLGTPFPKLSAEDRASMRLRVEGFITAMSIVFGPHIGKADTVRAMLRDMELFEDVRRG